LRLAHRLVVEADERGEVELIGFLHVRDEQDARPVLPRDVDGET
jgi:hypothetical protein